MEFDDIHIEQKIAKIKSDWPWHCLNYAQHIENSIDGDYQALYSMNFEVNFWEYSFNEQN